MLTGEHGETLLTPGEAAALVRVSTTTIGNWRRREILKPFGEDDRGFPVYEIESVRAAEREVRRRSLEATGADPRAMRKPKPRARATA